MGRYSQLALECSARAERSGALVPLETERVDVSSAPHFVVRRLLASTPKHLRREGPKPNPFLPWDRELEVERLGESHVLLLNKYPVQRGHLLLITQHWQPQSGWLDALDWRHVARVDLDSTGLWFFNSSAAAGASQPHRHLQLLPRSTSSLLCPLQPEFERQLQSGQRHWPWRYCLSQRRAGWLNPEAAAGELEEIYHAHALELGLGSRARDPGPLHPYNLVFGRDWLMTVRREREHWAGFSVNALGFAGYLLVTQESEQDWLHQHGGEALLAAVAVPAQA